VAVDVGTVLAAVVGVTEGASVDVGVEVNPGLGVGVRVGAGTLKWNWARATLVPARQAASTAIVTTSPAPPTMLNVPVNAPSRPT
jgi:hypothetical protein